MDPGMFGPPPGPPGPPGGVGFVGGPLDGQVAEEPLPPDEAPADDPVASLRTILENIRAYMDVETDEEDIAVAATCLANIQKLLGKNQKEAEQAIGVSPAVKHMAKQQARGGGY